VTVEIPPAGYDAKVTRKWIIPQGADTVNGFLTDHSIYGDLAADGWSGRAQIRDSVGGEVWIEFTSDTVNGPRVVFEDDVTVTDTAGTEHTGSTVTLVLPAATTEAEAWNDRSAGVYDLELVAPDGQVTRYAKGPVAVKPDVTRSDA